MITLLPADFVLQPVTVDDLQIASIAWGFTLGFGFLTVWTAIRQTADVHRRYGFSRLNSTYVWMIWLEILVCLIFCVICWLYLNGIIPPSFAFYFVILTTWALQVQFLLQIIINRVSILLTDRRQALKLRLGVAAFITAINISVYCIWIPARLQISAKYERINVIWDRCEKVIYLTVDAMLNYNFIRIVQKRLVNQGLVKYDKLVRFNMWIIGFSLSMDILIIGMMSLKNSFVYMQFHPLAYIVKLNIEMSMADLIAKVAGKNSNRQDVPHSSHLRSHDARGHHELEPSPLRFSKPTQIKSYDNSPSSSNLELNEIHRDPEIISQGPFEVNMKTEVLVQTERRSSAASMKDGSEGSNTTTPAEDYARPWKVEEKGPEPEDGSKRTEVAKGMGVSTRVFV